jgi:hypothetical protein
VPHRELCLVALCAQQVYPRYYLYHKRGLTELGLVLFHSNLIILRLMHNMIGMGTSYENVTHVNVMFGSMYVCLLQICYDMTYCFICWCTPRDPEKGR